jgi:predicted methyltransferase
MAAIVPVRESSQAPLLTLELVQQMQGAAAQGTNSLRCSLDLGRSESTIDVDEAGWSYQGQKYPYPERCRERTVYYWSGSAFEPAARYGGSLIKLVPTEWGAPTFEIDGIKMLPTARLSPYEDARLKVALIEPRGKVVLDCCGGLGYFAAWCLDGGAQQVLSFEKNAEVLWLRSLNPWSPQADARLSVTQADIAVHIRTLSAGAVEAALHDPPRFGIAGELYSQEFYGELARVLRRRGKLFHYTGSPNKLTSGRDVPREVARRLQRAGFRTEMHGDGVLAVRA